MSCDGRCLEATWKIEAYLPYLEGHFPESPVVPAVAILDATLHVLKKTYKGFEIEEILNSKFMQPILPEMRIRILAHEDEVSQLLWNIDWKLISTDPTQPPKRLVELKIQMRDLTV